MGELKALLIKVAGKFVTEDDLVRVLSESLTCALLASAGPQRAGNSEQRSETHRPTSYTPCELHSI